MMRSDAALHGVVHRRHAGVVDRVHVGALLDQHLHHIDRIVAVAGLGHFLVAAARRAEPGRRHHRRGAVLDAPAPAWRRARPAASPPPDRRRARRGTAACAPGGHVDVALRLPRRNRLRRRRAFGSAPLSSSSLAMSRCADAVRRTPAGSAGSSTSRGCASPSSMYSEPSLTFAPFSISIFANAYWPLKIAVCSAENPYCGSTASMSAPRGEQHLARLARALARGQDQRGQPALRTIVDDAAGAAGQLLERVFRRCARSRWRRRRCSAFTTAAWFSLAASISAVWPRNCSAALTLAPRSSSAFTASRLPVRAAIISGVSPSPYAASAFGARAQQRRHHRRVADVAASCSGVTP